VIGSYEDRVASDLDRGSETTGVESDSVSVYLKRKLRGLDLRTRLTVSDHEHLKSEHDELIGATSRASFDGRTTELVQRAGYPVEVGGGAAVLTPWLELTHRRQEIEEFTISNPYVSDVTYSGTEVGETLAGIGLDARVEPIALGETATLRLFGGLGYAQSLARDDHRLTIGEAAGLGADQVETIEREQLRRVTLSLGGEVGVRLSYRF